MRFIISFLLLLLGFVLTWIPTIPTKQPNFPEVYIKQQNFYAIPSKSFNWKKKKGKNEKNTQRANHLSANKPLNFQFSCILCLCVYAMLINVWFRCYFFCVVSLDITSLTTHYAALNFIPYHIKWHFCCCCSGAKWKWKRKLKKKTCLSRIFTTMITDYICGYKLLCVCVFSPFLSFVRALFSLHICVNNSVNNNNNNSIKSGIGNSN